MTRDILAQATRRLRLSGAQIDSITPPVDGQWSIDWDEYEEFVRADAHDELLAALRQAERDTSGIAQSRIREALRQLEASDER